MDYNDLFKYTFQSSQEFMCEEKEDYSSSVLGYRVETLLAFLHYYHDNSKITQLSVLKVMEFREIS